MFEPNLGIYSCDNQQFHSKIAACFHSEQIKQPVKWWFHDEVYNAYPWHVEPEETLDQLYDRRARELREQYDYIIVSYSGGADSHNVVESFRRQGLHIDEIITNHITSATQRTMVLDPKNQASWNFNAEHQLQALPRLNELKYNLPRTKFTVIDVSDVVLSSLQQFEEAEWVMNRTEQLSVGQLFRYNYYHFASIKNKFDQGQKVAIVVGCDKPKTWIDQDWNFHLKFVDRIVNINSVNEFNADYTNVRTELFYWAGSTAPLVAKQAHLIKRWLESNSRNLTAWYRPSMATARLVQERILRNLIYTTWNNAWYQSDKSTNLLYTEFDTWFHQEPEFQLQQTLWHRGVDYLFSHVPSYISRDDQGRPDGLKTFSKDYIIGKIAKPG